ncbi:MAG TPA: hypothetical protein VG796_04340 [Verrucomicrobiales bacterium]|nr:hypothetical protein [Verrucomicrobiales bacterium]
MRSPTCLLFPAAAALLTACSGPKDPVIDDMPAVPTITDAAPVPTATGKMERFVIKDKQQRLRVDGRVQGGHMQGPWTYYDPNGEKLAMVTYKIDQRHGPAQLFYVTSDGPAVGRVRMTGSYADGSPNGMVVSHWPSGTRNLERDFDRGILQGARGWTEKGVRLSDGAAMKAAIEESKIEEALLTELENFVQLQMRKKGTAPADSVPDTELEPMPPPQSTTGSYPGGTPSLAN